MSVAAVPVLGRFVFEGHLGISFFDEAHLWYGAQRMGHGDLPLRDFQSYDPGRYVLLHLAGLLFGQTPLVWRFAATLCAGLSVFFTVLLVHRFDRRPWVLALTAVTFTLWLFPAHKVFEITASTLLVWALTRAFELRSSSPARAGLVLGVCIGIVALFARNFALYGLVAALLGLVIEPWVRDTTHENRSRTRHVSLGLLGGIVVGYAPMWLALLTVPGMAQGFKRSLETIVAQGSTSLPRKVPWPFRLDGKALWPLDLDSWSQLGESLGFTLTALLLCLVLFRLARLLRAQPSPRDSIPALYVALAATLVALPCLHHASVRSNVGHLAQSVHPLWLAVLAGSAALGARRHTGWLLSLLALGLLCIGPVTPYVERSVSKAPWQALEIRGTTLWGDPDHVARARWMQRFAEETLKPQETFWAPPFQPLAYVIANSPSPTWEIFTALPMPDQGQSLVAELEANPPNWILYERRTWERRQDLLLENSRPLVWNWIKEHYDKEQVLKPSARAGALTVWRLREGGP